MITALSASTQARSFNAILGSLLVAWALSACGDGGDTGSPGGDDEDEAEYDGDDLDDEEEESQVTEPSEEGVVGFWAASVNCGQFDLAYGMALCSTRKVAGIERVAAEGYVFEFLDHGTYDVSDETVTLSLSRVVVEPSEIRGDTNSATLTLAFDPEADQLVVVDAEGMPECTGLPLERTDTVIDADCELDDSGGDGDGDEGCSADSDCGSCERCERSTGNCLTKLSC